MSNNDECLKHSISNCDIPTQKQWYKQQFDLLYQKLSDLKKDIKDLQFEYIKRTWVNNRKCLNIQKKSNIIDKKTAKYEWQKDYKELCNLYQRMSSAQVNFMILLDTISDLRKEYRKICNNGGFLNE